MGQTRRWRNQDPLLAVVMLASLVVIGSIVGPGRLDREISISHVRAFSSSSPNLHVNFTEDGLPAGTSWGVTLGTVTMVTNSSELPFLVSNGSQDHVEPFVTTSASNASNASYAFVVGSPVGYSASPGSGVVHVQSQSQTISVHFALNDSGAMGVSPRVDSLSGTLIVAGGLILLAVAGAVIVIALVLGARRKNLPMGVGPMGAGVLVLPPPPPPSWAVDEAETDPSSLNRIPSEVPRLRSRHPYP